MNIRELSKGSFVQAWSNDSAWMLCQAVKWANSDDINPNK